MEISMYRKDIPEWVKSNWLEECPYCKAYIADNSDTGVTTARWCLNPRCPGHMAYKMMEITKFLGIKGIGPKTAVTMIQQNGFKNHLDAMLFWTNGERPVVRLSEVAVLACIRGLGRPTAESELGGYGSFAEYFQSSRNPNIILWEHQKELFEAETYFIVKPPLSKKKIRVMATDSFYGYGSREEYFDMLNELFGQYAHIIQTGKRKTGISYLICEDGASDSAKMGVARDCGIPIITPIQFVGVLNMTFPGAITNERYEEVVMRSVKGGAQR